MRICIPNDDRVRTIPIGRCGENLVTELAFDVSEWLNDFGSNSTIRLLLQRPTESAAYPCVMTLDGRYAVYKPTSADCQYIGSGKAELRLINGELVAKSKIYSTVITNALDGSGTTPSPWQTWMDAFEALVDRAETAAETAEEIAEELAAVSASASVDSAYGTPSVVVTKTLEDEGETTEHYNFDFAFHNLKGDSVASITKTGTSGLVDTYTVTYTSGATSTFQITNGNGISSVTLNADYTLTINFQNGTSTTTGSIRGAQGEKGDKGDKGDTGDSGVYVGAQEPTNGANVWINPEGGAGDISGIEYIDGTITYASNEWTFTSDKTPAQVQAIIDGGKMPIIRAESAMFGTLYGYMQINNADNDSLYFAMNLYDDNSVTYGTISEFDSSNWVCQINGNKIIPNASSSTEGKVLTSNGDGSIAWKNASGGSAIEFVTFAINSEEIISSSHTPTQVKAMITAGKLPIAKITYNNDRPMFGYFDISAFTSSGYLATFQSLLFMDNGDYLFAVAIRQNSFNEDTWRLNIYEKSFTNELPSYSSADAGKVLSVNSSGELEWISLA